MHTIKLFWKKEEGVALVVGAILLTAMLGFLGLAMDVGNLVYTKTCMQSAVDAGALAGALALPNQTTSTTQAATFVNNNLQTQGLPSVTPTVSFTQDTTKNPNNYPEINVSISQNVRTYIMGVLGISSVPLSAAAEAVLISSSNPGEPFFNSSGSPNTLFSVQNLIMNGSMSVTGSVFTDASLTMNGSQVVNGNAVGVDGITMNGSENISGYAQADSVNNILINGSEHIGGGTQGGATSISLPTFSQAIINATSAANTYSSSQTFNGITDVTGSIYVNGNVIINGSVNWSGCILATGSITINGSSQISGSNQVFLYSESGNITENGSCSFGTGGANGSNVIAYAPNGTIIINGSSNWYGLVIGNQLTLNGSGNFIGSGVTNLSSLPAGAVPSGSAQSKLIN